MKTNASVFHQKIVIKKEQEVFLTKIKLLPNQTSFFTLTQSSIATQQ
jgi:hypothetical protein